MFDSSARPFFHSSNESELAFRLKRARRGGVTRLLFTPHALLARVAALLPRPMNNQVLYFGALSPASPYRKHVIPDPPDSTPARPTAPARPARLSHADLLQRVFALDVRSCPCGGNLRLVAVVQRPTVEQAIAAAIIICNQRPPRGPPPDHPRRQSPARS